MTSRSRYHQYRSQKGGRIRRASSGNSDAPVSACDTLVSTNNCTRTKEKCASCPEGKGGYQARRYSLQQHTQKHDQNTADHAQHQDRGDRLFVLCCDHGEQVRVLTPHPDEAWVAPAAGADASELFTCVRVHQIPALVRLHARGRRRSDRVGPRVRFTKARGQ